MVRSRRPSRRAIFSRTELEPISTAAKVGMGSTTVYMDKGRSSLELGKRHGKMVAVQCESHRAGIAFQPVGNCRYGQSDKGRSTRSAGWIGRSVQGCRSSLGRTNGGY